MLMWAILSLLALCPVVSLAELVLPPPLVSLNSEQGERILLGAKYKSDYWALGQHFTTQINGAFCGPASVCTVLNALGIARPPQTSASLASSSYNYFDQTNVFDNNTELVVPQADVLAQGMSLEQLSAFIAAHQGASAWFQHSDSKVTLDVFRSTIVSALSQPDEFLICNFNRAALNERGGGHHSPLAAYNADSDMVLVLDVSRYKYPAWWVPVPELYNATTGSTDPTTNDPRGLVVVWRSETGVLPRVGPQYITAKTDNGGAIMVLKGGSAYNSDGGSKGDDGDDEGDDDDDGGDGGNAALLIVAFILCFIVGVAFGAGGLKIMAERKGYWRHGGAAGSSNGGGGGGIVSLLSLTKGNQRDKQLSKYAPEEEESPLFTLKGPGAA